MTNQIKDCLTAYFSVKLTSTSAFNISSMILIIVLQFIVDINWPSDIIVECERNLQIDIKYQKISKRHYIIAHRAGSPLVSRCNRTIYIFSTAIVEYFIFVYLTNRNDNKQHQTNSAKITPHSKQP